VRAYSWEIGDHTYGHPTALLWGEPSRLFIGKYCSIGGKVSIFLGGNHRVDWVSTYPFSKLPRVWPEARGIKGHPQSNGDVRIGNDVWIGMGASILSGVKVGDGAVIGAYSLVTRDVPAYAIVGGNPAKLIRYRFPPNIVDRLLETAWWNLPEETVRRVIPFLLQSDAESFLERITALMDETPEINEAPHRFWRILVNGVGRGKIAAIGRLELRTRAGGPNVAVDPRRWSASSQFPGGTPSVSDFSHAAANVAGSGGPAGIWAAQPGLPTWIAYDFAEVPRDILEIQMSARSLRPEQTPTAFHLEWSDDGVSWMTVLEVADAAWGENLALTFTR
jgi:acetyltransferase-like isoleucine patch superfamily enzyme